MYLIYFLIYSIISYKTDFGFEYTNGFELLWGSIVAAFITQLIDITIFKISYDWTGFLSKILKYSGNERKTTHWKFRSLFSIPVLIFSLSPLCSMCMTPLIHFSYVWLREYFYETINQISEGIISAFM